MRAIFVFGLVVALAGCSDYRKSVESSAQTPQRQHVAVNYKGPDGFRLAVAKAGEWCTDHYGHSDVHLLKDDPAAGRATFVCMPLE